jgi:uncharacterized membrane protein
MSKFFSFANWASIIEGISFSLEIMAVLIILTSIILAIFNLLRHFIKHDSTQGCIDAFKRLIGKGVQVALELLIGADIIHTVVLESTLENVAVLAALVLIRTFLAWTLMFETEGRWPWGTNKK